MVEPQAEIAAAITDSGRVGVLATPNTVESGAYRRALEAQGRALEVTEVEAPDLAPFIQDGSPFDEGVLEMARAYCAPLKRAEVDTLILGCTHYPLVAPMLQRILGRDVRLVSGGHAVAAAVQRTLERGRPRPRARRRGRLPLPLHRRRRVLPRARHPLPADAARRRSSGSSSLPAAEGPTLRRDEQRSGAGSGRCAHGDESRRARARRRAADDRRLAPEGRQARQGRRGRGAPARAQEAARGRRGLPRGRAAPSRPRPSASRRS